MRSESRIFNFLAVFLYLCAGTYAWWTGRETTVEWIGTIALILSGTLAAMCGFYFGFVARRIDPRPEDRQDAEIEEGAGTIGFFSPGSYWPVMIAASATATGVGLIFLYWWLVAAGLIAVILGGAAMIFEYYTGTRRGPV